MGQCLSTEGASKGSKGTGTTSQEDTARNLARLEQAINPEAEGQVRVPCDELCWTFKCSMLQLKTVVSTFCASSDTSAPSMRHMIAVKIYHVVISDQGTLLRRTRCKRCFVHCAHDSH